MLQHFPAVDAHEIEGADQDSDGGQQAAPGQELDAHRPQVRHKIAEQGHQADADRQGGEDDIA